MNQFIKKISTSWRIWFIVVAIPLLLMLFTGCAGGNEPELSMPSVPILLSNTPTPEPTGTPLPASVTLLPTANAEATVVLPLLTPISTAPSQMLAEVPATFTPIENSAQYLVVSGTSFLWNPDNEAAAPFKIPGFLFSGWHPSGQHLVLGTMEGQYSLFSLATGQLETMEGMPALFSPVWSPDGQLIALRTTDDKAAIFSLSTGVLEVLENAPSPSSLMRWSPDGKYLFYLSDQVHVEDSPRYLIYDLETKTVVFTFTLLTPLTGLGWSPDAQWIGLSTWDGEREYAEQVILQGVNVRNGESWRYENPFGTVWLYGYWSSTYNRLLLTAADAACGPFLPPGEGYHLSNVRIASLELIDFDKAEIHQLTRLSDDKTCGDWRAGYFIGHSPWSPSGDTITYAVNQRLCFFDIPSATESCLEELHELFVQAGYEGVSRPSWSPDGEWIAFFLRVPDHQGEYVAAIRPDGTDLRISTHIAAPSELIWSPLH